MAESFLKGRTALVTGGAIRLGREIAKALAAEGCEVIIQYNTSRAEADGVVDEVAAVSPRGRAIQADFTDRVSVRALIDEINRSYGKLDILINSASSWPDPDRAFATHAFETENESGWDLAFKVNAEAPFFLIQALSGILSKGTNPVVINILDRSVSVPFMDRIAHTLSKRTLADITMIGAEVFRGKFRMVALELPSILPPEKMPEKERARKKWGSVKSVVDSVLGIISGSSTGYVERIPG